MRNGRNEGTLLGQTHLGREGAVRLPLRRRERRALLHHLVDLLQGQALGFVHQEERVNKAAGAQGSPDEEDLGVQVALVCVHHVRGDDSNDLKQN